MFDAQQDLCLGFFKALWESDCPDIPHGGRVLEIGCAEANWLKGMREARPDLHLTGIDWRNHPRPAADVQIHGDVLVTAFEPQAFDAIIAVSMLEWAGVSHYGDPVHPDGDRLTMQRARTWIMPTGWLYFDVPYARTESAKSRETGGLRNGHMRVYTDQDLEDRLLQGQWTIRAKRYFTGDGHPDGPYVACVCEPA